MLEKSGHLLAGENPDRQSTIPFHVRFLSRVQDIDTMEGGMLRVLWFSDRKNDRLTTLAGSEPTLHIARVDAIPEILLYIRQRMVDVAVLSVRAADAKTDDLLLEILRTDSALPVIVDCPSAQTDDIIRLIRLGAFHVWSEPLEAGRINSWLCEAASRNLRRTASAKPRHEAWREAIVGESEPMCRILDIVRLVAARRSSVLITGETGTGKEVIARAIHVAGGRGHLPFVAVNCSAIPENLVEAELFGYVKGAFTGAIQARPGKFEQADGGTIFLDEVGELPLDVQAKLLRVLQEREVQRIGGSETTRLNVRVIAATNANLGESVRRKIFREDLYYRLNVVPVELPPLRERRSDIPALAEHFLERICAAEGIELRTLTAAALRRLTEHPWPGNVRQLEHAIEMAVVLCGARMVLDICDFPLPAASAGESAAVPSPVLVTDEGLDLEEAVSRFERTIVQQALLRCGGNKARAAQLLRMKRTTLLARMKSLESRQPLGAFVPEHACA
jgi:DNA-binding NtrC family response regulator